MYPSSSSSLPPLLHVSSSSSCIPPLTHLFFISLSSSSSILPLLHLSLLFFMYPSSSCIPPHPSSLLHVSLLTHLFFISASSSSPIPPLPHLFFIHPSSPSSLLYLSLLFFISPSSSSCILLFFTYPSSPSSLLRVFLRRGSSQHLTRSQWSSAGEDLGFSPVFSTLAPLLVPRSSVVFFFCYKPLLPLSRFCDVCQQSNKRGRPLQAGRVTAVSRIQTEEVKYFTEVKVQTNKMYSSRRKVPQVNKYSL